MADASSSESSKNPQRVDGKIAAVTGASSGIGRAIALELADAGANVIAHYHSNSNGAAEVVEEIRGLGREAVSLRFDLSDITQQNQLADDAWSWRGQIDIWVNNAGVDVLTGQAAELSFDEKLEMLWSVDVLAAMRISRNIGQRMSAANDGRGTKGVILNMGWDQADFGMSGDSGEMFAAVKSAVMAFSKSLAKTLAPNVRVNCLAPGWIKTSWGEHASEFWQDVAVKQALLQRWGTPEDVAHVARFLASPASDFITGQVIPINGGFRSGI